MQNLQQPFAMFTRAVGYQMGSIMDIGIFCRQSNPTACVLMEGLVKK